MCRFLVQAVLVLFWAASVAAAEVPVVHTVDLNVQGALKAVQRSRPEHYMKIGMIVHGIFDQPDYAATNWLKTTFNARNVSYPQALLVSLPPQRRLSFSLDDTRYVVTLTETTNRADSIVIRNSK